MTISLLVVGKTGTGKSTIGNVILTGQHDGVFVTDDSPISCTAEAITCSGKCGDVDVSFTDTPGIPDTYPERTKDCYDAVINSINNEPLSAILFVFEYGRIDYDLYQKSEILFREINKANCLKVLIINDHADRSKKPVPNEQYAALADAIGKHTKITFVSDEDCWVDYATMPYKMQSLMKRLQSTEPVLSSGLTTFAEVAAKRNMLKSEAKRYTEEKARIVADINNSTRKKKIILKTGGVVVGTSAAAIAVGAALCLPVVAVGVVSVAAGGVYAQRQRRKNRKKINELKNEEDVTNRELKVAENKLAKFETNFNSLYAALGVVPESNAAPNVIM